MKIERFEEIEAWQLARELTRQIYRLTKKPGFEKDYGLKRQIQEAAGCRCTILPKVLILRATPSSSDSCDTPSGLAPKSRASYVALDENYISPDEFKAVYDQAGRTRAAARGFINYLREYKVRKAANP